MENGSGHLSFERLEKQLFWVGMVLICTWSQVEVGVERLLCAEGAKVSKEMGWDGPGMCWNCEVTWGLLQVFTGEGKERS